MSRDYKSRKPSKPANENGGSAFFGGFVGYALGLASAIGIWLYLNYAPSPFLSNEKVAGSAGKSETQPAPDQIETPVKPAHEEPLSLIEEKPRFDFYKILPGIEEPEIDQTAEQPQNIAKNQEHGNKPMEEVVQQPVSTHPSISISTNPAETTPPPAPIHPDNRSTETAQQPAPQIRNTQPAEKYFLQAGSFRKNDEAESLKARLALLGVLASIQAIDLAERGVWYRVRIGPFTKKEEIDETTASLKENGIETQFIKIN